MKNQWLYIKDIGKFLLGLCLLLWTVFTVGRIFFLIFFNDLTTICNVDFLSKISVFYHGFRLDISTIAYLLIIPFILISINAFFSKRIWTEILKYYLLIILILNFLIVYGEIGLYREWQTKISTRVFNYLGHPDEIYRSTSGSVFFGLLTLTIISVTTFFYVYCKWIQPYLLKIKRHIGLGIGMVVIGLPLLFLGMRGGFQQIPITQSNAYFCNCEVLNHASLNSTYNMMLGTYSLLEFKDKGNTHFMPEKEAENRLQNLLKTQEPQGHEMSLIDTSVKSPNIVLIILEGWSSDMIASLSDSKNITPNFSEIERDGVLFTRMYASGTRSHQGIAGLISGIPAPPFLTVTTNTNYYSNLESLVSVLKAKDYQTYFTYGGSLDYGNLKAYLSYSGYDHIIEESNFPLKNSKLGRLGYHDEAIFTVALQELNHITKEKPFIYTIFTQSSHPPYDYPKNFATMMPDAMESPYLNSVHYSDGEIGKFIAKAKKEAWYANTLFIMIADHSHLTYKNRSYFSADYRHIPMVWFGNLIKSEWKGKQIHTMGMQSDIPKTLLNQLQISAFQFEFSKNILTDNVPEFVFFEFSSGFGWLTPEGSYYYNMSDAKFCENTFSQKIQDSVFKDGQSFLQIMMQRYMKP